MVLKVRQGTDVPADLERELKKAGINIESFNPDKASEQPRQHFQVKPSEIEIPIEFK